MSPTLLTELKVNETVMRLISEEKIKSDLGKCLIIALDENDRVVYASEPHDSNRSIPIRSLLGKDFKKLSTLTSVDLGKTDQIIKNNLLGKIQVSWFITAINGLKILIE